MVTTYLVPAAAQDTISVATIEMIAKDSTNDTVPRQQIVSADTPGADRIHTKRQKGGSERVDYGKVFSPDPNKAMWSGLLFPGLGQIYNRKYWKLPIVYGGFVALAYGISWNDRHYQMYKRYYRDIADSNPDSKSYEELYEKYDPSIVTEARLKDMTDNYRRYRDLCIIGSVAFYAITIIDAFVDASLANFDISPYLSLKVTPTVIETDRNKANMAIRLNLRF